MVALDVDVTNSNIDAADKAGAEAAADAVRTAANETTRLANTAAGSTQVLSSASSAVCMTSYISLHLARWELTVVRGFIARSSLDGPAACAQTLAAADQAREAAAAAENTAGAVVTGNGQAAAAAVSDATLFSARAATAAVLPQGLTPQAANATGAAVAALIAAQAAAVSAASTGRCVRDSLAD